MTITFKYPVIFNDVFIYTVHFKNFSFDWYFNWQDDFHSNFTGLIKVALRGDSIDSKIPQIAISPVFTLV